MQKLIDNGLIITPCDIVDHPKGEIVKIINKDDDYFFGFGEAYTTSIKYNEIKGWKMHKSMRSTLFVLRGAIEFSFFNDKQEPLSRIIIHEHGPTKINTVKPIWLAFKGYNKDKNTLLNISDIKHEPGESINLPLNHLMFDLPELIK